MADIKKIEFAETNNALAELSEMLLLLGNAIDEKKAALAAEEKKLQTEAADSKKRLKILKDSSQNVINNIDSIINKLDKVLENDGSGNNNN